MLIDLSKPLSNQERPSNEFETKVLDFVTEWFSDSKIVKIQSSGSTGIPKIFEIEKSKMLNSAEMTCNFLDLKEGNVALICLPIEYISGKMMVVRSILRKLKLKIVEPSTNPLQNINDEIDFCAMTPLQVENSLDKLHLIKNLIIGGASVSETLKTKITKTLKHSNSPTRIFETYGMSETLSHIALRQIFPNQEDWFAVFEGVEISLDERDCLKIFAPKLNSEILQTNDLVEINNKNQFRFLGRLDNAINSGGAKIFPEELEKLVKQNIPNEAVFLGIDDEKLGQKLILIIEGESDENLKSKIYNLKFQKSFHKPKDINFVEKIPRTPNGKVNRLELKKLIEK
ncbi:AMP-binding protein [Epilithonimonas ginsengisoli]|uniref:AMP-binding protein n=1 Tax=Epilithonimonas ginsengisoli TaxID=1245592 RepID=A0ABU4JLL5_9FLAO|nr:MULTISPECIES: AMP-binding protein [Chryseobacterium group]MBV6881590.1 AMP-binding protein [Epilithonimonas sp. FP105]MDW8550567.1 AMP-binding protein [Epilithonimonas ginsengisoli]OAH69627.1 AMP-dependent synthetase [Chryseobacterium sp. FP211-J200]